MRPTMRPCFAVGVAAVIAGTVMAAPIHAKNRSIFSAPQTIAASLAAAALDQVQVHAPADITRLIAGSTPNSSSVSTEFASAASLMRPSRGISSLTDHPTKRSRIRVNMPPATRSRVKDTPERQTARPRNNQNSTKSKALLISSSSI
jgi:hypothetical protein